MVTWGKHLAKDLEGVSTIVLILPSGLYVKRVVTSSELCRTGGLRAESKTIDSRAPSFNRSLYRLWRPPQVESSGMVSSTYKAEAG